MRFKSPCASMAVSNLVVVASEPAGMSTLDPIQNGVLMDLRGGTSSASNNNPSGSIHSPRIGRKPSSPPQIKSIPAGILVQAEDGRSNYWKAERKRGGSLALS